MNRKQELINLLTSENNEDTKLGIVLLCKMEKEFVEDFMHRNFRWKRRGGCFNLKRHREYNEERGYYQGKGFYIFYGHEQIQYCERSSKEFPIIEDYETE